MITMTLLTQQSCGLCEQAKDVLNRLASEYDLEVCEVSLDTEAGRALGMRHGVVFAPGILVDDELFSYGRLSERKLRREFERRDTGPSPRQARR